MKVIVIIAVIAVSYLIAVVIAKFAMAMDQVEAEKKYKEFYKEEAEKELQKEIERLTEDFTEAFNEEREKYRRLNEKYIELKAKYEGEKEQSADNRIVSRETLR